MYLLRIVVGDQPLSLKKNKKALKLFYLPNLSNDLKEYISLNYSLKSSFIEIYFVHELFVFQLNFNGPYIMDPSLLSVTLFLKYFLSVCGF